MPDRPGAWLWTAARRKAIDRLRRDASYRQKLALLQEGPLSYGPNEVDDRLRLIFTCCHPALPREAQVALTLRAVVGLTTPQIARAFLVPEATIAQRIVRAKRKILQAGIPYRIPSGPELDSRRDEVLTVLYLMFNEGYLSSGGETSERRELAQDAAWLGALMANLMPDDAEVIGLLALVRLHLARAEARFDPDGGIILLQDQDRGRWDHEAVEAAVALLRSAPAGNGPGPFQLQAEIAASHARAPSWEETRWEEVLPAYDLLVAASGSPVVRLNRAVALRYVAGPEAALVEVDQLAEALDGYHLFHETRAQLLDALGRAQESREAHLRAIDLTQNPAERALIESRLATSGG